MDEENGDPENEVDEEDDDVGEEDDEEDDGEGRLDKRGANPWWFWVEMINLHKTNRTQGQLFS